MRLVSFLALSWVFFSALLGLATAQTFCTAYNDCSSCRSSGAGCYWIYDASQGSGRCSSFLDGGPGETYISSDDCPCVGGTTDSPPSSCSSCLDAENDRASGSSRRPSCTYCSDGSGYCTASDDSECTDSTTVCEAPDAAGLIVLLIFLTCVLPCLCICACVGVVVYFIAQSNKTSRTQTVVVTADPGSTAQPQPVSVVATPVMAQPYPMQQAYDPNMGQPMMQPQWDPNMQANPHMSVTSPPYDPSAGQAPPYDPNVGQAPPYDPNVAPPYQP